MTNLNSTATIPLPQDAFIATFFVIGLIFTLGAGFWFSLIAIEKLQGHFKRLWWMEHDIKELKEKVGIKE